MATSEWISVCVSGCERERAREYQSNFKVKIYTYTKHSQHITGWHLNLIQSMRKCLNMCLCLWPQKNLPNTFFKYTNTWKKKTLALNHLQWIERMNLFTCTMCASVPILLTNNIIGEKVPATVHFNFLCCRSIRLKRILCLKIENSNWKPDSLQGK